MIRVLLIAVALAALVLFLRQQYQQSPRRMYTWLGTIIGVGLIALVLTGRAHWMMAMIGGILPFLGKILVLLAGLARWLPFLSRLRGTHGAQEIRLQTAWLDVTLNRATGTMDGTVRQGEFAGLRLSGLRLPQLESLLRACQSDPQSAALLRAYLQRTHTNWQDTTSAAGAGADSFEDSVMSAETAAQILGVAPSATETEIKTAHRSLAQKFHPDRGGNDYLARKINQARDTLLKTSQRRGPS